VRFRSVPAGYDPTDRPSVFRYLQEQHEQGDIVTGLLYLDETVGDIHEVGNTPEAPLARVPFERLCPGAEQLDRLQMAFR
jgi:2-oxoglutarate ferredoxin oxidoreductase subunit beta